jgi:signal transduction histidine kinase
LGSALSQVAILSEVAKRDATPASAALMTETANLARSMRESLSDIVWAADPRRDRLTDLVYRMRQVAVNNLEFDGVHVDFRAPADDEIERVGLAPDRRRHLLLIFKEAITNIGRHASASRVSIEFAVRGRSVALTISDDGRGFDTAVAQRRAWPAEHGAPGRRTRGAALAGINAWDRDDDQGSVSLG